MAENLRHPFCLLATACVLLAVLAQAGMEPEVVQPWASWSPESGPANEVHLALNPLDGEHLLVVAQDYGQGDFEDCGFPGEHHVASAAYATWSGGDDWTRRYLPTPMFGFDLSPMTRLCGADPMAVFGPDGTAYYAALNFDFVDAAFDTDYDGLIAVARSADGGGTWPLGDIRVVAVGGEPREPHAAVDEDGRIHVVWEDNDGTEPVLYRRSTPGFDFTDAIVEVEANTQFVTTAAQVATGPGDKVYVFWRDTDGGPTPLKVRVSEDEGASFGAAQVAINFIDPYGTIGPPAFGFLPAVAVDHHPGSPHAGRIYVAWQGTSGPGTTNVWLRHSDDDGGSWSLPVRVDGNADPALRSLLPAVSVAPNGHVDVAWIQEVGAPGLYHVVTSRSTDGGATWGTPAVAWGRPAIAELSEDQDGIPFLGDSIGLASASCTTWLAYPVTHIVIHGVGMDATTEDRSDAVLDRVEHPCLPQIVTTTPPEFPSVPDIDEIVEEPCMAVADLLDGCCGAFLPCPPDCMPFDCPPDWTDYAATELPAFVDGLVVEAASEFEECRSIAVVGACLDEPVPPVTGVFLRNEAAGVVRSFASNGWSCGAVVSSGPSSSGVVTHTVECAPLAVNLASDRCVNIYVVGALNAVAPGGSLQGGAACATASASTGYLSALSGFPPAGVGAGGGLLLEQASGFTCTATVGLTGFGNEPTPWAMACLMQ